ncbi:hypothetical protein HK097_010764 [Rhizophlyctis rosea]|uniref:Rpr2-domain-containing protein n=1 Tax=Rhizophlyctis rosea TaxID=64517 RepID=A0AAD5S9H0_9FUNG|nr:hypothetical protein HK097_010764 [Rhizophlyctis rosea]
MDQPTAAKLSHLLALAHKAHAVSPQLSSFYLHTLQKFAIDANVPLADRVGRTFCSRCTSLFVPTLNCTVNVSSCAGGKKRKRDQKAEPAANQDRKKPKRERSDDVAHNAIVAKQNTAVEIPIPAQPSSKKHRSVKIFKTSAPDTRTTPDTPLNHIIYTCHTCKTTTYFTGLIPSHRSSYDLNQKQDLPTTQTKPVTPKPTLPKTSLQSTPTHSPKPIPPQIKPLSTNAPPTRPSTPTSPFPNSDNSSSEAPSSGGPKKKKKDKKKSDLQSMIAAKKKNAGGGGGVGAGGGGGGLNLSDFLSTL